MFLGETVLVLLRVAWWDRYQDLARAVLHGLYVLGLTRWQGPEKENHLLLSDLP